MCLEDTRDLTREDLCVTHGLLQVYYTESNFYARADLSPVVGIMPSSRIFEEGNTSLSSLSSRSRT
jgi:hypothetical protein